MQEKMPVERRSLTLNGHHNVARRTSQIPTNFLCQIISAFLLQLLPDLTYQFTCSFFFDTPYTVIFAASSLNATLPKMTATEAFPLLSTGRDKLGALVGPNSNDRPRVRRRSSGLGGEIRAGDTSVPALATLDVRPPSPGTIKVRSSWCFF